MLRHSNIVLPFLALILPLSEPAPRTAAQEVDTSSLTGDVDPYANRISFSRDGRLLREAQLVNRGPDEEFPHVRTVTYDALTGRILHVVNLKPDTRVFSTTIDGEKAIVSLNRDRENATAKLLVVDMDTGKTEEVPWIWFDCKENNPYGQISGDGRLVSGYSENGPEDGPVVVTVYKWQTKKMIGRYSTGFPAGGFIWGGVTSDGQIEIVTNRSGGEVVNLKTGKTMAEFGVFATRSPDGAWIIEFPNQEYVDATKDVVIKNGMNGKQVGKLDLQLPKEKENWGWRVAYCGKTKRVVAATLDTTQMFELPSGRKIVEFPSASWQDTSALYTDPTVSVACNAEGNRVAIRSGTRLTLLSFR